MFSKPEIVSVPAPPVFCARRDRQIHRYSRRGASHRTLYLFPPRRSACHLAGTAVDHIVGLGVPGQRVVIGRSREILEAGDRVRSRTDRILGSRDRQVHRHCRCRVPVGDGVGSGPAGQRVVGGKALDGVVARSAVDHIGVAVARQRVVIGRSREILEAGDRVRSRTDGILGSRDRQALPSQQTQRPHLGDGVGAAAARQDVIAGHRVTLYCVVVAVASQRIPA